MKFSSFNTRRLSLLGLAVVVAATAVTAAYAQSAPQPARQAIEARKAVFTLIGQNCRVLADVVKGAKPFDAQDVKKRADRIAALSEFLNDAFPDISNTGEPDTKTKAEAWTNAAEFGKEVKKFQEHSVELAKVAASAKDGSEAFKTAFGAVAQDCKSCHDTYRAK